MKNLKDKMKNLDEKYVSVEALTEQEKEDTCGGSLLNKSLITPVCYAAAPIISLLFK